MEPVSPGESSFEPVILSSGLSARARLSWLSKLKDFTNSNDVMFDCRVIDEIERDFRTCWSGDLDWLEPSVRGRQYIHGEWLGRRASSAGYDQGRGQNGAEQSRNSRTTSP